MNTQPKIIPARKRDLGGFIVHRSIPHPHQRSVGPFVFLDHMGPLRRDEEHQLNVRPHPHIGLATVTFLYEGRGHHRDSLGFSQVITPGDVNLMTAGRGVVHSERTPENDQHNFAAHPILHGVQMWVALPLKLEECEPSFQHYPQSQIPSWNISDDTKATLLLGKYEQYLSPVHQHSPTLMMDLLCSKKSGDDVFELKFNDEEVGIFLAQGQCTVNGMILNREDLILVEPSQIVRISMSSESRILIIGGKKLTEPRYMWWNFVSSRKERIHQAAREWQEQSMGQVIGENEYIPLPGDSLP